MTTKYYCKYCGTNATSIFSLTNNPCSKNPNKGKHVLYEGSEKSQYTCKFCGSKTSTIFSLTNNPCSKNPNGRYHEPAL